MLNNPANVKINGFLEEHICWLFYKRVCKGRA